jgi:hypothetical protein
MVSAYTVADTHQRTPAQDAWQWTICFFNSRIRK